MLPTWHGIPAKAFQVSFPAAHLARNPRKSVSGVLSPLPTCYGFPAKVFQVSLPAVHLLRFSRKSVSGGIFLPPTCHGFPAKAFQVAFPASHLPRFSRKSVPGGISPPPTWHGIPAKVFQVASPRRPPGTESPQKCSRCLFPLPTWHGIPAKACQVSLPAAHLARYPRESVPGSLSYRPPGMEFLQKRVRCLFPPSTWHGIPAKAWQVAPLIVHLARNPRKSVPGVLLCRPPGTVFPRKCSRCHFPLPTWHGIPAKAFQVSLPAAHLARNSCESVPGGSSLLST